MTIYDKLQLADMNALVVSTKEKPIVGTWALATCHGILLYDKKNKIAILGHASTDYMLLLEEMIKQINQGNKTYWQYMIIPGNYRVMDKQMEITAELSSYLNKYYTDNFYFIPFEKKTYEEVISIDPVTESSEVAFDASTGKFVTDKIEFKLENFKGKCL